MLLLRQCKKFIIISSGCETIKPYDVVICSDCVGRDEQKKIKVTKKLSKNIPFSTDARYCYSFNSFLHHLILRESKMGHKKKKSEKVILMQNL